MSDFATEYTRVKNNIINAYTQAELKGATLPAVKNSENLSTTIDSIPNGGASTLLDIAQVLLSDDTPGYNGKYIQLCPDVEISSILYGAQAFRTSDGSFYTSTYNSHTWDTSKDIPYTPEYDARWVTFYSTYAENALKVITTALDIVVDLNINSNLDIEGSSLRSFVLIRPLASYLTSLSRMFRDCKSLQYITGLDTSNVTNLSTTFYGCSSLIYLPELDVSNVTDMTNTFYACGQLKSFKLKGLKVTCDLSPCPYFTHDDLVYILDNLQSVSGQTLTIGNTNLSRLSTTERAIATNKGWTLK